MGTEVNIAGQRFGRLVALGPTSERRNNHVMWRCVCDCGKSHLAKASKLRDGAIKSCGCSRGFFSGIHGDSGSREHRIWKSMITRCTNPRSISWKYYGAVGVTVCDRWRQSYAAFLSDMGRAPSEAHSIDRINTYGNYEPSNCRWATWREQNLNKRRAA